MQENDLLRMLERSSTLFLPEPLSYVRFMNLVFNSLLVITDSGGLQEETSYLGIPCLTIRKNTERPITVTRETNKLCELNEVTRKVDEILRGSVRKMQPIEFWDGRSAERIVAILRNENGNEVKASTWKA